MPGGVSSPVRACGSVPIDPPIFHKGKGDMVWDVDGNGYVDYCMSWGALLHGHAHEAIVREGTRALEAGSSFGATTPVEERFASLLVSSYPSIEKVRFLSSGTEATMTAVRLARARTKRPFIVKCTGHYHGHADPFLVRAGSGVIRLREGSSAGLTRGSIENTLLTPFNDVEALSRLFADPVLSERIAGVIVEPVAANMGVVPATPAFLERVRFETERAGALLLFDEVVTGFRIGPSGAEGYYSVRPDLVCLGKIIGGGFPVAACGGKREIMDLLAPSGDVYQAGTLSGNPVAMSAGEKAVLLALREGFYEELREKTEKITLPVAEALEHYGSKGCIRSVTGMFALFWGVRRVDRFEDLAGLDVEKFGRFFTYLYERGVYLSPSPYEAHFLSAAHSDAHLAQTRDLIADFLRDDG